MTKINHEISPFQQSKLKIQLIFAIFDDDHQLCAAMRLKTPGKIWRFHCEPRRSNMEKKLSCHKFLEMTKSFLKKIKILKKSLEKKMPENA